NELKAVSHRLTAAEDKEYESIDRKKEREKYKATLQKSIALKIAFGFETLEGLWLAFLPLMDGGKGGHDVFDQFVENHPRTYCLALARVIHETRALGFRVHDDLHKAFKQYYSMVLSKQHHFSEEEKAEIGHIFIHNTKETVKKYWLQGERRDVEVLSSFLKLLSSACDESMKTMLIENLIQLLKSLLIVPIHTSDSDSETDILDAKERIKIVLSSLIEGDLFNECIKEFFCRYVNCVEKPFNHLFDLFDELDTDKHSRIALTVFGLISQINIIDSILNRGIIL
ncbi:unnamed protein product, partial [marine sediment metagenome]